MSQCVTSRTNCIVFHGKIAGSQVYGHNEFLLCFPWTEFGSCTCTWEIVTPFPMHPGIEKRGVGPPHDGIWSG